VCFIGLSICDPSDMKKSSTNEPCLPTAELQQHLCRCFFKDSAGCRVPDGLTGARLNFAENLLRYRTTAPPWCSGGKTRSGGPLTYAQLYDEVARVAKALKAAGVKAGDRVAGFMPNMPESIIAMLAATSLGATWSSCSPDFGIKGVLDRFGQIKPKVCSPPTAIFSKASPSTPWAASPTSSKTSPPSKRWWWCPTQPQNPDISAIPNAVMIDDFKSPKTGGDRVRTAALRPPPLHHVLLRHHRAAQMHGPERRGHPDPPPEGAGAPHRPEAGGHDFLLHHLRVDDVELAGTSSLAWAPPWCFSTATPSTPTRALWQMAQDEKITVFGTSAGYLAALQNAGVRPGEGIRPVFR
jgi:acetoacetyl-CoA synthetase